MLSTSGARLSSVLALALLAGCANTPAPCNEPEVIVKTRTIDNSCRIFKPIYPTASDVLADSTARQITSYNETGAEHCGWKPPSK